MILVVAIRMEQRLGTLVPYRWMRHTVRLVVPAALMHVVLREDTGHATPSADALVTDILADSSLLGGAIAVIVCAQVDALVRRMGPRRLARVTGSNAHAIDEVVKPVTHTDV